MDTFTDLVEKKKLFHRFQYPYTIHVSLDLSHDGEHQTTVQQWRREKRIGVGGFGKVFLEVLKIPQTSEVGQPAKYKFRAVKEIPKSGVTDQTYKNQTYKRELKAIVNFSQEKYNDFFVESYGWFHTDDTVFIAMEYFKNGDLGQHLQRLGKPLPVLEAQQIAVQILEGLYFMHSEGFTHRDLKPAAKSAGQAGTILWAAPEYFDSNERTTRYTSAVDIWSFGVIVFYMLTGKRPFLGTIDVIEYGRGQAKFPESAIDDHKTGANCVDFLKKTIAPKPEDRLNAYCSLEHSWLRAYRESSSLLKPIEEVSSTSTSKSPPLPASGSKLSEKEKSKARSEIGSSSASGTWGFLDKSPGDATAIPIRNGTNPALKSPTLPISGSRFGEKETSKAVSDEFSLASGARGFIDSTQPKEAGFVPIKEAPFTSTLSAVPYNRFVYSEKQASEIDSDNKPSVSIFIEHSGEAQSRAKLANQPWSYSTDDGYVVSDSSDADSKSSVQERPIICIRVGGIGRPNEDFRASPVSGPLYLGATIWLKRHAYDAKTPKVDKLRHQVARGNWTATIPLACTLIEQFPSHPSYGDFQCCLGFALFFHGRYEEAELVFHEAHISRRATGDFTVNVMLAETLFRQGRQDESISFVRQALKVQRKNPLVTQEKRILTQYVFGDLLGRDLNMQSDAVKMLTDVISQSQSLSGSTTQGEAYALASLADCYSLSEDWMMAAQFLQKAIATKTYIKGVNWKSNLLEFYSRAGQEEEALIYFRNDVKDVSEKHGTHNIHLLESQYLLWRSLMTLDRRKEARVLFEKIAHLRRELQIENEVWPAWLAKLNELVDFKRQLSEEKKSTRYEGTRMANWNNPLLH
ncbi:Tetratricopeptide-like helical [Penicillium expansum]|nr:Tetratricopeptide-like helical [Penicillium expansum]KGO40389.1 Tetratricopeptide-like helical [Penicillium expansum]